jgi:hypothetical protein
MKRSWLRKKSQSSIKNMSFMVLRRKKNTKYICSVCRKYSWGGFKYFRGDGFFISALPLYYPLQKYSSLKYIQKVLQSAFGLIIK